MRVLELVAVVLFALGSIGAIKYLVRVAPRRETQRRIEQTTWEPHHELDPGSIEQRRNVYVRKDEERELVDSVLTSDPDYDDKFHLLMSRARERAATYNSES